MSCQSHCCDCSPIEEDCDCADERPCTACGRQMQIPSRRCIPPPCATTCACSCVCPCKAVRPRTHHGNCKVWNTNCPPKTTPSMEERFKELVEKWSKEIRLRSQGSQCNCSAKPSRTTCCNCDEEPPCRPVSCERPCSGSLKRKCSSHTRRSGSRTLCMSIPWEDDPANNNCRCPPEPSGLKLWKGVTLKFRIGSKGVIGSPEISVKDISNRGNEQTDSEQDEDKGVHSGKLIDCRDLLDDYDSTEEEIYYVRKIIKPKVNKDEKCTCDDNKRRVSIDESSVTSRRSSLVNRNNEGNTTSLHPSVQGAYAEHDHEHNVSWRSHTQNTTQQRLRNGSHRSKTSNMSQPIPAPYYDRPNDGAHYENSIGRQPNYPSTHSGQPIPYQNEEFNNILPNHYSNYGEPSNPDPRYVGSNARMPSHHSSRSGSPIQEPYNDGRFVKSPSHSSPHSAPPNMDQHNAMREPSNTSHRSAPHSPSVSHRSQPRGTQHELTGGIVSSRTSSPQYEGSNGRKQTNTSSRSVPQSSSFSHATSGKMSIHPPNHPEGPPHSTR